MNPWRWVDPRVGTVRLEGIRAYLAQRGYVQRSEANPHFLRFEAPARGNGDSTGFFVLPASEQFGDYVQSITYFLTTLSELEDRHPVAILEELLQCQAVESQKVGAVP
jgi:hypothetical protein